MEADFLKNFTWCCSRVKCLYFTYTIGGRIFEHLLRMLPKFVKYDWNFCNYFENNVPTKNNREKIKITKTIKNNKLVLLFEGATQFAAGGVVGNACRMYSCCCVFCNCCVFELDSLEGAPRFAAGGVVGNACRRYLLFCIL